ncbi:MAG: alpha/beta fold hydrolase [Pseudomonadota bacterium]
MAGNTACEEKRPSITMQEVGGQVLRTAYWRAEVDMGKRPLLFFNGIGANLELALGLGEMIRDRDIITFDVPGVGESPATAFPYRPWMLARWARMLLDQFGIEDVDVMGVSWGGAMAQQFAIQYRNRVGRLILCATTAGMTMVPGRVGAISKMRDPRRYTDPNFMRENFEALYGDDMKEGGGASHVSSLKPPSPKGYMFQLAAFLGWSSLPFIRFLRMPTLVLAGGKDRIVPMANARILNMGLPNSRLHVIEDGGHLFLVTKSDETLPVITDFLDELEPMKRAGRAENSRYAAA